MNFIYNVFICKPKSLVVVLFLNYCCISYQATLLKNFYTTIYSYEFAYWNINKYEDEIIYGILSG